MIQSKNRKLVTQVHDIQMLAVNQKKKNSNSNYGTQKGFFIKVLRKKEKLQAK